MNLNALHWKVLYALSDGLPQHISYLAQTGGLRPHQLNGFWQQMPPHIRGLLRQYDGQWRLVRPLAVFDGAVLQETAAQSGFSAMLENECTSSNDVLLALARQSADRAHKVLCVAHSQTHGRGRQGNQWQSRLGECLMFSFGWVFDRAQHELGSLALAAALACNRALAKLGLAVQIKWPNDLVAGCNKLGGILIETVRQGGQTVAVVGIGINFVVPKDVDNTASVQSLLTGNDDFQTASPHKISATTLLGALLAELEAVFSRFAVEGFEPLRAEYQAVNRDMGKEVVLLRDGKPVTEGIVSGVDADGALLLETETGRETVVSGEISLRRTEDLPQQDKRRCVRYLLIDGGICCQKPFN